MVPDKCYCSFLFLSINSNGEGFQLSYYFDHLKAWILNSLEEWGLLSLRSHEQEEKKSKGHEEERNQWTHKDKHNRPNKTRSFSDPLFLSNLTPNCQKHKFLARDLALHMYFILVKSQKI